MQHPEIDWIERTGYPSWMQPKDPDYDLEKYEIYCDRCFEERREKEMFGDD